MRAIDTERLPPVYSGVTELIRTFEVVAVAAPPLFPASLIEVRSQATPLFSP